MRAQQVVTMGLSIILLGAFASSTALGGVEPGETHSGNGVIVCRYAVWAGEEPCDPTGTLLGGENLGQWLETGAVRRVTFLVEWTPVADDASELEIALSGNQSACINETGNPECFLATAVGESPLSVSLEGAIAANTSMWASVGVARPCDPITGPNWIFDCDQTDIRIVRDQPFTFTWIVE